jgi:hypothetical protein
MIERWIPERESALIVHALVFARKYIPGCACYGLTDCLRALRQQACAFSWFFAQQGTNASVDPNGRYFQAERSRSMVAPGIQSVEEAP